MASLEGAEGSIRKDDGHPDYALPGLVEFFGSSLSETEPSETKPSETEPSEDESSENESSENGTSETKPKDELIRVFKQGRKRGLMVSFVSSFRDARRLLGKNNLAFTKQDFGDCLGPFNWREYVVGWDGYGTVMFETNCETAALITIAPPDAGFTVYRGDETELIIVANGDVKTVVMVLEGRWALKIKSAAKT